MVRARAGADDSPAESVDVSAYHQIVAAVLDVIKDPAVPDEAKNESLRSIIDKIVFHRPENTFDFYFVYAE